MGGSFPVTSGRARWKRAQPDPAHPIRGHAHPTARYAARYTALVVALATLIVAGELISHAVTADPRDPRTIADRELTLNVLSPGEHALERASVFLRPGIDYFRATRGLLVRTDRRLVFLGLRPRDLLSPPDAPPTFVERDFALDTLVQVRAGRAFLGFAKGVVIRAPDGVVRLGVPTDAWPDAQRLIAAFDTARQLAVATGVQQRTLQVQADAQRRAALINWRKPQYYIVQRGDALGAIATQWNVTVEALENWNHLANSRIRLGQTLLVRPRS